MYLGILSKVEKSLVRNGLDLLKERGQVVEIEAVALICSHVFKYERPIKVVIHHDDGVWQLVCGDGDHPDDCSDFRTVGLEHLIESQSNISDILNLECNHIAELIDGKWVIENFVED